MRLLVTGARGLLGAAIVGAIIGFAPFNRPVARLFLGDVGSLPVGLMLGWILMVLASRGHLAAALLLPLYAAGIGPGDAVLVPPGVDHGLANTGTEPLRLARSLSALSTTDCICASTSAYFLRPTVSRATMPTSACEYSSARRGSGSSARTRRSPRRSAWPRWCSSWPRAG